jgi:hypothetical protein
MRDHSKRDAAIAAAVALFGLLTLFSGGMALFGPPAARAAVGNAIPFVLWFNFFAGFVYLLGAALLFRRHRLAQAVAWGIGLATLGVFALFWLEVAGGAAFEMRTVGAMLLRAGIWLAIAIMLWRRQKHPART